MANLQTDPTEETAAYPTEERIQQKAKTKARKDKGIKPKKRPKVIEDHYDDCGTDLSGPGVDPESFADNSANCLAYHIMNNSNLSALLAKASGHADPIDLIEICG